MFDCLVGIDEKIKRAEKHIGELKVEVDRFFESDPYCVFSYSELDSRDLCFAVTVVAEPPPSISAIVGDLINNLRNALDYLMCGLFEVNGQPCDENVFFPITWKANEFKSKLSGIERGAGKDVVDILQSIEAYKGGAGHALWQLHQLNSRDKHRLLIPIGSAYQALHVDVSKGFPGDDLPSLMIGIRPDESMYPLKDGAILFKIKAPVDATQVDMHPKFTLEIAFGEGKIVQGEPIIPTLQNYIDLVKGVIEPFRPLLGG